MSTKYQPLIFDMDPFRDKISPYQVHEIQQIKNIVW